VKRRLMREKRAMSAMSGDSSITRLVSDTLAQLSRIWSVPELRTTVTVKLSRKLRTSLGRATPATGRVSIHPALRAAPAEVLREVLCHEIAHVVAYRRARAAGATRPRAHGVEWAAPVRAAGYEPLVRAPRAQIAQLLPPTSTKSRAGSVLHVCPVCQMRRVARRAVPAWRCSACVAIGLDGRMEVVRLPAGAAHG
jgi:predicted SprT family Zn-dependent metalloprotease